jgi:hypothetical protein
VVISAGAFDYLITKRADGLSTLSEPFDTLYQDFYLACSSRPGNVDDLTIVTAPLKPKKKPRRTGIILSGCNPAETGLLQPKNLLVTRARGSSSLHASRSPLPRPIVRRYAEDVP